MIALFSIVVLIPIILTAGLFFGDRNYAITSTLIVVLSMLPFFLMFERRRPQARGIVPVAVMAAIAAVSRLAFAFAPQFKPIVAVVIITAAVFGAEAGFLCGSVSMLVSNFFFGQGPWTPWQMFCCGLIGFAAGCLADRNMLKSRIGLCVFGIISGYVYGAIVEIWSVVGIGLELTWQALAAAYISGFWFNTILAASTALFLLLIGKPVMDKLERIKIKYGIL